MFEPITIMTGFLTMWAQLNNYGIDTDKYPHLKNIRVRRESPYRQENTDYNPMADLKDSIIMKNIYSVRSKRQTHANNMQNDYPTTVIPLANYPKGSQYYSQNTNGIPYYYNAFNGNNKVYIQNNAYNRNNNGQNNYGTNEISSKIILKKYGGADNTNVNNTLLNNGNNNGLNNGNNNGLNNRNNNGINNENNNRKPKRKRIYNGTILSVSFMGSSWCPEFLHSVKIGGSSACVGDDYDYA